MTTSPSRRCSRTSCSAWSPTAYSTKFPEPGVVLIESGVTWLPGFIWRADQDLARRACRGAVGEAFARRHHPRPRPPDRSSRSMRRRSERRWNESSNRSTATQMLLFATDYPHWQFEGDAVIAARPAGGLAAQRIRVDNPLATYPRLKETVRMNAPVERRCNTARCRRQVGHHRLRHSSLPAARRDSNRICRSAGASTWREYGKFNRGPLRRAQHLSALLAEHVAARCVAAVRRTPGLRSRFHARAASRSPTTSTSAFSNR